MADKNKPKFFFTLRYKGDPIKITDHAKLAVAKAEGRCDASGKIIEDEKPKADPVDKAIQLRLKGGALTNVVPSKEKKEELIFKLKLVGGQPKISDVRKDPNEALAIAAAEKEADLLKLQKTPCIIDIAIQERLKAGSYTSTVASKEKDAT